MSLSYILKVTGDCQNTGQGAVYIEPTGGVPPYDINWTLPYYPTDVAVTSTTRTGLSIGTYAINITDSTTPDDLERQVLFTIGDSFCISIEHENSFCDGNNGSILVTAFTSTNNVTFDLYTVQNNLVDTFTTNNGQWIFAPLAPNGYYVIATDESGCTGKTKTCYIKNSPNFDFDFFIVDNSQCFSATGRVYVIDQTSNGPFTYSWSNGATTSFITGLTSGSYSVTITDINGCSKTKIATVKDVPKLGYILTEFVNPSCNQANGELTFYFTGGSQPIKYTLSNGSTQTLYDNQVTFTSLPAGTYTITAVDPGKCSATTSVVLTTPDALQSVLITPIPSICNNNQGGMTIQIQGGTPPYYIDVYTNFLPYTSISSQTGQVTLNNLPTGSYYVVIRTATGCLYDQQVTVVNKNKFTLTATTGSTSCGLNNGFIKLEISSGGTSPFTYEVNNQVLTSPLSSQTFSNLASGIYNVSVTDKDGCVQSDTVLMPSSKPLNYTLFDTGCVNGDDATILLLITSGDPPFTIEWSPNVIGQSGVYLTGLSEGEYYVTVTDKNGCKLKKTTKIVCGQIVSNYSTFNLCSNVFVQTPNTIFGISQIYAQGFQDVTNGQDGCTLNSAEFVLVITIGATTYTTNLGTFTSLGDYPTDQQVIDEIETLLGGISGTGSIVFDLDSNFYAINTDCDRSLSADTITVDLNISYDFCCIVTTTTTCSSTTCKKYSIEVVVGGVTEFVYTPCDTAPFYGGNIKYVEFCADSTKNIFYATNNAVLKELGCCECNNSPLSFFYSDVFTNVAQIDIPKVVYVSGNTLPLSLGDILYTDICLTQRAPTGYYLDYYSTLIYYYDKTSGIYKIDNF